MQIAQSSVVRPASASPMRSLTSFEEKARIIDPDSSDGRLFSSYLSGIATRLLTASDIKLQKRLEFCISDSDQPNAYVSIDANVARIVVSKEMLTRFAENEDQIAFVIAHELVHVAFAEKFKQGRKIEVTKLEEYLADLAGTIHMLDRAGYAPHQAQKLFDKIAKLNGPTNVLNPWVITRDVHGLNVNRAAAIGGAIADILTRRAVCMHPTPINEEVQIAGYIAAHESYVDRLKAQSSYSDLEQKKKFERLLIEIGGLTKETQIRRDELTKELESVINSFEVTPQEIERALHWVTRNPITISNTRPSIIDILRRRVQKEGDPETPPQIDNLLKAVDAFVNTATENRIFNAASRLEKAIETVGRISIDLSRWKSDAVRNLDIQNADLQEHIRLATRGNTPLHQKVARCLWALGVRDDRLISNASDGVLETLDSQPVYLGATEEQWKEYLDQAHGELERRRWNAKIFEGRTAVSSMSIMSVSCQTMVDRFEDVLYTFRNELRHPDVDKILTIEWDPVERSREIGTMVESLGAAVDRSGRVKMHDTPIGEHYRACVELSRKFTEVLQSKERNIQERGRAFIRDFFLSHEVLSFRKLIGPPGLDTTVQGGKLEHPLIHFVINTDALSVEEKMDFLRGLDDLLPATLWHQVYLSGLKTRAPKAVLKRLNEVAPEVSIARDLAAAQIVEECRAREPEELDIIAFMHTYPHFFGALRKCTDDERNHVLRHIQAVASWDMDQSSQVAVFAALERGRLFPEGDLREKLRASLLHRLKSAPTAEERVALGKEILLSSVEDTIRISSVERIQTDGARTVEIVDAALRARASRREIIARASAFNIIQDTPLREQAMQLWAEGCREIVAHRMSMAANLRSYTLEGRDDGSAKYQEIAQPILDSIAKELRARCPIHERKDMLKTLASVLQLQVPLSLRLRDRLLENSEAAVRDAQEYLQNAELGLEFLSQDPDRRDAAYKFLSRPLSRESCIEFTQVADIFRDREFAACQKSLDTLEADWEKKYSKHLKEVEAFEIQNALMSTDIKAAVRTLLNQVITLGDLHDSYSPGVDRSAYFRFQVALCDVLPNLFSQTRKDDIVGVLPERRYDDRDKIPSDIRTTLANHVKSEITETLAKEKTAFTNIAGRRNQFKDTLPIAKVKREARIILQKLAKFSSYDFVNTLEEELENVTDVHDLKNSLTRFEASVHSECPKILQAELELFDEKLETALERYTEEQTKDDLKFDEWQQSLDKHGEKIRTFIESTVNAIETTRGLSASIENEGESDRETDTNKMSGRKTLSRSKAFLAGKEFSRILLKERDKFTKFMNSIANELDDALPDDEKLSDLRSQAQERCSAAEQALEAIKYTRGQFHSLKRRLQFAPIPIKRAIERLSELVPHKRRDDEEMWTVEEVERFDAQQTAHHVLETYNESRTHVMLPMSAREEQVARQIYETFWSQGQVRRTVALKILLVSPEEEFQDRQNGDFENFKNAANKVANEIFPEGMKYAKESRKLLNLFLEETDETLRGFMLSALMAASQKIAGSTEEMTAGKRLSLVLSMLGPAEKKLAQAINSHPMTPEDLRSETKSTKSMTDVNARWESMVRFIEAIPAAYRNVAIPRLGAQAGAASYYETFECGDTIVSLLRQHAREQAKSGLDRMERVARRAMLDPDLAFMARPFIETIEQTRDMIKVETNHRAGAAQVQRAWQQADGFKVSVHDTPFKFETAEWYACGPEFRHQKRFTGEHFLDLSEDTSGQREFKRRAAISNLVYEFRNFLSGKAFDYDRHGAQEKIEEALKSGDSTALIGLFDHGCMALDDPTEGEKREAAEILTTLFEGFVRREAGLLQRAHEIIRDKREREGTIPTYLVSIERLLLALNDYMGFDRHGVSKYLQPNDLSHVLIAVFRNHQVDEVFLTAILDKFGGAFGGMAHVIYAGLKAASPENARNWLSDQIASQIEKKIGEKCFIGVEREEPRPFKEPIIFDQAGETHQMGIPGLDPVDEMWLRAVA